MAYNCLRLRRPLLEKIKREIKNAQNNKCFYCGHEIGSIYFYKGKHNLTKIHWDHFIPVIYSRNNQKENYVMACNICNLIKGTKIFDDVAAARKYIEHKIKTKGYKFHGSKIRNHKKVLFGMPDDIFRQPKKENILQRQMPICKLVKKTSAFKPRDKKRWERKINFQTGRIKWFYIFPTYKEKINKFRIKNGFKPMKFPSRMRLFE